MSDNIFWFWLPSKANIEWERERDHEYHLDVQNTMTSKKRNTALSDQKQERKNNSAEWIFIPRHVEFDDMWAWEQNYCRIPVSDQVQLGEEFSWRDARVSMRRRLSRSFL